MAAKAKKITPPNRRGQVGRQGEELAADFLQQRGFTIIERNWHCRAGEIDLIVEREGIIRFVEVKTRRTMTFGYPEEAVSFSKRQRWFRAIEFWVQQHGQIQVIYQADVISILWTTQEPAIEWIENVEVGS